MFLFFLDFASLILLLFYALGLANIRLVIIRLLILLILLCQFRFS